MFGTGNDFYMYATSRRYNVLKDDKSKKLLNTQEKKNEKGRKRKEKKKKKRKKRKRKKKKQMKRKEKQEIKGEKLLTTIYIYIYKFIHLDHF